MHFNGGAIAGYVSSVTLLDLIAQCETPFSPGNAMALSNPSIYIMILDFSSLIFNWLFQFPNECRAFTKLTSEFQKEEKDIFAIFRWSMTTKTEEIGEQMVMSQNPNIRYDSMRLGNLYMPYDSNQTMTFQTPDSDYCNIRIPGDYSISSTPKLDLNNMNLYDPRRPGLCMVPYSPL